MSVSPSVTPFSLCSHHGIIMDFCRSYDQWPKWGPCKRIRSEVKVKVKAQLNRFQTATPVWIHIWWRNDAQSLMLLKRSALFFFQCHTSNFKVTIERFPTVTPVRIHWWLWNNAYSVKQHRRGALSFFPGNTSNFKVTRDRKIAHFDPIWTFPDYNLTLNSPMDLKWCTKLNVA